MNKKCGLLILIMLLLILSDKTAGSQTPSISSFQIVSNEIIRINDNINITIIGTPGGKAWIEIANIPVRIYIPETSPGIYEGIYTLKGELPSVYNCSVFAHMTYEGINAVPIKAVKNVTIISSGPLFYDLTPPDNTMIKDMKPTVYAAINGGGSKVDVTKLRIIVNKLDVTGSRDTILNPEYITFRPSYNLKEGENRIQMYGETIDGKTIATEWNFFIKLSSSIKAISHNATKNLVAGEILEVHLIGDPYEKAYFDIGDWKKNIPMNESFRSPGTYIGTYTVQKGDYVVNAPVTGYLDIKGGGTTTAKSAQTVSILANELVTRVNEPKDGQMVANQFNIIGQTRPFTTIRIDVKVTYTVPGLGMMDGGLIGDDLKSDALGVFKYNVTIPTLISGSEYKITATAIDAQGNRSVPHTIKVYQK